MSAKQAPKGYKRRDTLSAILQALPVGVGVIDPRGRFVLRNSAMNAFAGEQTPAHDEQTRGRWRAHGRNGERMPARDFPGMRALRGETVLPGVEFLYEGFDGREIWTRVSAVPIDYPGCPGRCAVIVVEDIDRVKRVGLESAARLDELQSLYDAAPVGLCMLDRDLRFVRINRHLAEINGHPVEDHLGRTVREVVPEIAAQVVPALLRVIQTGEAALDIEITGETAARPGVSRSWREHWVPVRGEGGHVTGVSIVAEETTEQRRLVRDLAESENRFRNLADHAPVMIWVTDPEGQCIYLSKSWSAFTGQTEQQGHGKGWLDAVHPDDRGASEAAFDEANRAREAFRLEYRLQRADGAHCWVIVADGEGRLTFVNKAAAELHGTWRLETSPDEDAEARRLFTEDNRPYPFADLPLNRAVRYGETVTDARWRISRTDVTEIVAIGSAYANSPVLGKPFRESELLATVLQLVRSREN